MPRDLEAATYSKSLSFQQSLQQHSNSWSYMGWICRDTVLLTGINELAGQDTPEAAVTSCCSTTTRDIFVPLTGIHQLAVQHA